ncbi:FGGY-family carbohydrate kinase [Paenibacillus sp. LHD-117]|uniref:FGGY-family carbohydrate kinase n=1 Tax=Paenibacillus sp. LHD-117 TaxID=3071412 RepID=UPI0027DF20AE|nr:FGGY-family carbohydrate kinase [Paenibacillus sp. LHD-117]MDQ6419829.1 FGGY-family carbohydrate kinase [Paenibacillus sp. LHD-117]
MTEQKKVLPLAMVIDLGTTGGRIALVDSAGTIQAMSYREYSSIFHSPTVIDHDPETWLWSIRENAAELKRKVPELFPLIQAVTVTSQRATFIPVDAKGKPIAHAILWQDKRSVKEAAYLRETIGEQTIFAKTGLKIDPYFSLPKLLWLRSERAEIYETAAYFLSVHDFAIFALTGEFKTDWTQASRTMLFNIHEFAWDEELAGMVNIDLGKMPKAYPTGTIAGPVTAEAAEAYGIPAGLPVVMSGGDQQCAALGVGAIEPGIVKVTTGTGSFVVAPTDKPITSPEHKVVCSTSAVPGQWIIEAGIFTSGSTYRWLRDLLVDDRSYEKLNELALASVPGANGVLHVPHYAGSAAPYWNADATGVLMGVSLGTSRADIVRAYLEGICFEVNKNLRIIDSILQQEEDAEYKRLSAIHVCGGLVQFDLFNQIQADIFGIVVIPNTTEQGSAVGAAMNAFTSIGVFADLKEAHRAMSQLDMTRMKTTNRGLKAVYAEMSALHDALYHSLNNNDMYARLKQTASRFGEALEDQLN